MRDFDTIRKLEEYQEMGSLEYNVLVEPNEPTVFVWSRNNERKWSEKRVRGVGAQVALPAIGVTLKMGSIYEGSSFL